MKKFIILLVSALQITSILNAQQPITNAIYAGGEYILYHPYFDRMLAANADNSRPALVHRLSIEPNTSAHIYVAESSGEAGYYLLRHKITGKYANASTSNTWNVLLSNRATTNNFRWQITEGTRGKLVSKSNTSRQVGVNESDGAVDYMNIYYDKSADTLSQWQILTASLPFEQAQLALYTDELQPVIDQATDFINSPLYSESLRNTLITPRDRANTLIANAVHTDIHRIDSTRISLSRLLNNAMASSSTVWLSAANFDMGNNYTVGLRNTSLKANATAQLIIKNKNGRGATIALPLEGLEDTAPHNYLFAFTSTEVKIYADSALHSTLPVAAMTAGAQWAVVGLDAFDAYMPEVVSATAALSPANSPVNEQGKSVAYAVKAYKQNITLNAPIDFHILEGTAPITQSTINLTSPDAWLIFDNVMPSSVISTYLSSIRINNNRAVLNSNVRVAIYLNGAAIIPYTAGETAFTGYDNTLYTGTPVALAAGNHALAGKSNSIRSFILKRGYMATVASGDAGSGYSRVYVADHADMLVPTLPQALDQRISSVHIKKWNYVSKKGWASTNGNSSIATETEKMRATWFYTWSADRATTQNTEYVPIKQHLYWPSWAQINALTESTHAMSINEPEHAEQHTSAQCSCGGVIDPWKATTITPDFQSLGMRIGSPSPTDASWLTTYINHCNDMAYRVDFVTFHSYWGTNEAANPQAWYNRLKAIWDATKRPIWITEWNNGASWTTESWPSGYGDRLQKNKEAIQGILNVLDTCRFIERYAIYNWDSYYRAMIADDGWVTPAGEVYRDNKSTFAYRRDVQFTPIWWTPSLKSVTLDTKVNTITNKLDITITNPNGDFTDQLVIERRTGKNEPYTVYYTETNRSLYDGNTLTYSFPLSDFNTDTDRLRVRITNLAGETTTSDAVPNLIENPICSPASTTGWTVTNTSTNTGEAYDGNAGNAYWNYWNNRAYTSTMYQDLPALPEGDYTFQVLARGSTNIQLTVYVSTDGGSTYDAQAALTPTGTVSPDGSDYLNGWQLLTLPTIKVDGSTPVRLGMRAVNASGSAWWSIDEWSYLYEPNDDNAIRVPLAEPSQEQIYDLTGKPAQRPVPAGIYIVNGKKVFITNDK